MTGRPDDADVVVIGLGVHGSAAAASLARRGRRVIALDRFGPGHHRGSSHGRTRMIRRAYPHPVWNGLVDRAFAAWAALEAESGERLVRRTGGLFAHRGTSRLQGPGCVAVDDRGELARRMPGLAVPEGYRAVHDPGAGVIEAASALAALRGAALAHGAELRHGARVRGWEPKGAGVRVATDDGVLTAARLVIAAGPWSGALVPSLAPLFEVWRILTVTVRAGQPVGMPPRLGAFSVDRPEGLLFGVPDALGNGVKIGVDAGPSWDPEEPPAPPSPREIAELRELLASCVPGLDTTPVEAVACLYTMTEDRRFVIGPLADAPGVVVVAACSGHGFKFGPALGDAVADLCDGVPRPDLDFVSTARRGL
ncbi:N-methyl-L-tryptophan oxidase [Streptomyces radicis]|uniref:N-methyl-L-tryptophan oxidase n=1 Tax=Streptomyces radicis TaxID=1750517 RepID=A0A3A9VY84_9ACTN|nr:N-methyl-L-tryptophan oxidase [Streptomyces radicis]RKN05928.1 N-methyl-L-tryptophan oxidase [Streptomyces radicis]RKN17765.1 N-methyl-L-tryptophan oxidase [Streptomyces radicis]